MSEFEIQKSVSTAFSMLDIPVNNGNFSQYKDSSGRVEQAVEHLKAEGSYVDTHLEKSMRDKPLLDALETAGADIPAIIKNTSKFNLHAGNIFEGGVILPEGHGAHANGKSRREESGEGLSIDRLVELGIDPSQVVLFRVTQPSSRPKPEFYWTTDFTEVRGGLSIELGGEQRKTAVILIDTLQSIISNGGLMEDVNDDTGVSVRQIGLETYDQTKALGVIPGNY